MPPAPTVNASTVPGSDADQTVAKLEAKAAHAAMNDPAVVEEGFETSKVIALIAALLESPAAEGISSRKRLIKRIKTCYRFVVTSNDGSRSVTWWADMKKKGRVGKGDTAPCKPDVTIYVADRDLVDLATGKANPQKLFAAKRIRIRGEIDRALRAEAILTHERQKVEALAKSAGMAEQKKTGSSSEGKFFGGSPRPSKL